ncbi:MAG: FHA domain-containing protein [Myxococcaceae bacterium]|nr:FHA domain-containing protein [Myxococcaceae bacterium]
MAFQLVIAEGKEAGREFVFEQESVLIGRTSDCDVVLYDPGVSRKHARIFSEGSSPTDTSYFVEDMGSSNGTKVNGAIIKKKQLADGDAISLGPVVFNFAGLSLTEDSTDSGALGEEPANSTRIVSAQDVAARRTKGKGAALAPEGAGEEQLAALSRSHTRTIQAVKDSQRRSQPGAKALRSGTTGNSNPALAPATRRSGNTGSNDRLDRSPAPERGGAAPQRLSAAERARIKRTAGPLASLKILWAEANTVKRSVMAGGSAVVLLGLLTGAYLLAFPPEEKKELKAESNDLVANQPIEGSFGLGEGVDYERADQKVFDFEYKSPVKMVVVLHFQARDISANEVEISVNSTSVGFVPPDTLAVNERSNEALIPASVLLRNKNNKIAFDNTKNPPGNETWRIWNIWVEVFPLPELGRDELIRGAQDNMRRGQDFWDRRQVGAENLYKAWRAFRESWLTLESLEGSKPIEYTVSRDKMREAQVSLDRLCSQLLLEAQSAYNNKQYEAARSTLEHVNEFFPKRDQPCPYRAEQMREYFGI